MELIGLAGNAASPSTSNTVLWKFKRKRDSLQKWNKKRKSNEREMEGKRMDGKIASKRKPVENNKKEIDLMEV